VEISREAGQAPTSDDPTERDLFFGSRDDMRHYQAQAQAYLKSVTDSVSVRLIVIETWLFIDYAVRGLLMNGLQLDRLDHEDLDLRYTLLPRGFRDCVSLLRKLWKVNRNLPAEPEKPFTGSRNKWKYLDQFDPGLGARIEAAERSYYSTPDLGPCVAITLRPGRYRSVPEGWLQVAGRIDGSWVNRASRLNNARNLAAHSHDETRIAAKLGFHGPDTLVHVRDECLRLTNDLAGIRAFLDPVPPDVTGA